MDVLNGPLQRRCKAGDDLATTCCTAPSRACGACCTWARVCIHAGTCAGQRERGSERGSERARVTIGIRWNWIAPVHAACLGLGLGFAAVAWAVLPPFVRCFALAGCTVHAVLITSVPQTG